MNAAVIKLWFLLTLMQAALLLSAQVNASKLKPVASDCKGAIKIPGEKSGWYGPTVPPDGYGEVQEIESSKNDKYFFEKEHNSAWYYYNVKADGALSITITPTNPADDYDFLLFRYTDSLFCENVMNKKIIPLRTNISRTGRGGTSVTGLDDNSSNDFFSAGIGKPFSRSLDVKKGSRYYIVLDNVYPDGGGHTIEIGFKRAIQIAGVVLNEESKPIKAEVILEDTEGNEVSKTLSDLVTGKYDFKCSVFANTNYNLVFFEDSSFLQIKELKSADLAKSNYKYEDIKVVLPKLRKGDKYQINAINFYGDSPTPLPTAHSSMKALLKLMKKNPKMIISIEGHVNNPRHDTGKDVCQRLSENRAKAICDYLVKGKIDEKRMSTIGYGDNNMLFPKATTEEEMKKNRRVEIMVVDY